jgi:hypothetical protein
MRLPPPPPPKWSVNAFKSLYLAIHKIYYLVNMCICVLNSECGVKKLIFDIPTRRSLFSNIIPLGLCINEYAKMAATESCENAAHEDSRDNDDIGENLYL